MRYTQRTQLCDKMKARQSESCNCVQDKRREESIADFGEKADSSWRSE
jgi:hypothetical protein